MRVAQATWSRISKLSKHRIMDEIKSCNSSKLGDLDLLRYQKLPVGVSTYDNIQLTIKGKQIHRDKEGKFSRNPVQDS